MTSLIKRSLARGEISKAFGSRADLIQYGLGLDTERNFLTPKDGGAQYRPGFIYCFETKDSTKQSRLIPFKVGDIANYMLEVGEGYIRLIQDDALITVNPDPWSSAPIYSIGDLVSGGGVNYYCIRYHNNQAPPNVTYWYAMPSNILEIPTPYLEADLSTLDFCQSADVMFILSRSYSPRRLIRNSATEFAIDAPFLNQDQGISRPSDYPLGGSATGGPAGAKTIKYRATAINSETGLESTYGVGSAPATINSVSTANPCVVVFNAPHLMTTGDEARVFNISPSLDGRLFGMQVVNATTVKLVDVNGDLVDSSAMTIALGPGSALYPAQLSVPTITNPTEAAPITIQAGGGPTNIKGYKIYKQDPAVSNLYGFIGYVRAGSPNGGVLIDAGIPPNITQTPPGYFELFNSADNYPGAGCFYQQSLFLAGTNNSPAGIWKSRTASYMDFGAHTQLVSDDSFFFPLNTYSNIKFLAELRRLMTFLSSQEYAINGDQDGAITPTTINATMQSNDGSDGVKPVLADGQLIHSAGAILNSTAFNFMSDKYDGEDINIFSRHLLSGKSIVWMDYQYQPDSIIFIGRSDGVVLAVTFNQNQKITSWNRHDTDGTVEWGAVIPEDDEYHLYVIVNRTIDGQTRRNVERLATIAWEDPDAVVDDIFMDSCLSYDGRNTGSRTMTLTGGVTWLNTETLTLSSSDAFFQPEDTGNIIRFNLDDGTQIRFYIKTYTNPTTVTGKAHATVPAALRSVAWTDWEKCVDQLTGLDHLEGKDVVIFGDGFVVANPNDVSVGVLTVTNGQVDIPQPMAVIHVGLPYLGDIKTLRVDNPQGETFLDKKSIIRQVGVDVLSSRSFFAGRDFPAGDDPVDPKYMREYKIRTTEAMDEPNNLFTGVVEIKIPSQYSKGQVAIRHINPTRLKILSIIPAGSFPMKEQ